MRSWFIICIFIDSCAILAVRHSEISCCSTKPRAVFLPTGNAEDNTKESNVSNSRCSNYRNAYLLLFLATLCATWATCMSNANDRQSKRGTINLALHSATFFVSKRERNKKCRWCNRRNVKRRPVLNRDILSTLRDRAVDTRGLPPPVDGIDGGNFYGLPFRCPFSPLNVVKGCSTASRLARNEHRHDRAEEWEGRRGRDDGSERERLDRGT